MDFISIIIVLVVAGVLMWLINAYVPMEPRIKQILNIAVIIFLVLWLLLNVFGIQIPNMNLRI